MKKIIFSLLLAVCFSSTAMAAPNSYKDTLYNYSIGNSLNANSYIAVTSIMDDFDFIKVRAVPNSKFTYGVTVNMVFSVSQPNTYTSYSQWTLLPNENDIIPITTLNYQNPSNNRYCWYAGLTCSVLDADKVNFQIIGIKTLR